MSTIRINVEMPDADGCWYNHDYHNRLIQCVNKHRAFFEKYGEKTELTDEDKIFVKNKLEEINFECLNSIPPNDEVINGISDQFCAFAKQYFYNLFKGKNIDEDKINEFFNSKSKQFFVNFFLGTYINSIEELSENLLGSISYAANFNFLKAISDRQDYFDELCIVSGSARQSYIHDDLAKKTNATGSFFRDIRFIEKHFKDNLVNKNVYTNKITLADIYAKLKNGTSFERILAKYPDKHASYIYDEHKLSIIYAVSHAIASENKIKNKKAEITINFYDDREDILSSLYKILTENPELLPSNVTLNLYGYNGKFQIYRSVQGKGIIDYFYPKNVRLMAKMCREDPQNLHFDAASQLNVAEFLKRRVCGSEFIHCQKYARSFFPRIIKADQEFGKVEDMRRFSFR